MGKALPRPSCVQPILRRQKCAKKVNEVGLSAIRKYATTKRHPIRDYDKFISIAVYCIKHGPEACVTRFNCSKQYADYCLTKLEQLADDVAEKEE